MFARIGGYFTIIIALSISFYSHANLLTNQQINMLLENDDIQIVTSSSLVKKVSLAINQSTDKSQGKTIAEYDKKGLLINYYSASVVQGLSDEQSTMITTLLRMDTNRWQRKQTMGSYEIDNSIYTLKNGKVLINILPSYNYNEERVIEQQNQVLDGNKGNKILFNYAAQPEKEQLKIEYQFNVDGNLVAFDFSNVDETEYGYKSITHSEFKYDKQQKLIEGYEESYYQFMKESADKILTKIIYTDFDAKGNWQTKVEQFGSDQVIYKREIEYWN